MKYKYLLIVSYANGFENYFGDNPDILRDYAETKKCRSYHIYEINKLIYSKVEWK